MFVKKSQFSYLWRWKKYVFACKKMHMHTFVCKTYAYAYFFLEKICICILFAKMGGPGKILPPYE